MANKAAIQFADRLPTVLVLETGAADRSAPRTDAQHVVAPDFGLGSTLCDIGPPQAILHAGA